MYVQAPTLKVDRFNCAVLRCGDSLVVELTNGMCMTHERGSELFRFIKPRIKPRTIHRAGSYRYSIYLSSKYQS